MESHSLLKTLQHAGFSEGFPKSEISGTDVYQPNVTALKVMVQIRNRSAPYLCFYE